MATKCARPRSSCCTLPCVCLQRPAHRSTGFQVTSRNAPRSPVLAVLRSVLRLHRTTLPPPLRTLGDEFLREEFRRHHAANASTAQWGAFVREWQRYASQLRGEATAPMARSGELDAETRAALSPEQRAQLDRLRAETERLRGHGGQEP
jgi:hypothetical protein